VAALSDWPQLGHRLLEHPDHGAGAVGEAAIHHAITQLRKRNQQTRRPVAGSASAIAPGNGLALGFPSSQIRSFMRLPANPR